MVADSFVATEASRSGSALEVIIAMRVPNFLRGVWGALDDSDVHPHGVLFSEDGLDCFGDVVVNLIGKFVETLFFFRGLAEESH